MSSPDYTGYGTEFFGGASYGHELVRLDTTTHAGAVFATGAATATAAGLRGSPPFEVDVDISLSTLSQTLDARSREVDVAFLTLQASIDVLVSAVASERHEPALVTSAFEIIDV